MGKQTAPYSWRWVLISSTLFLLVWQLGVTLINVEPFILPGPGRVARQFIILLQDGRLVRHGLYTLAEVITGLGLGCLLAMPLGYVLASWPLAERLVSPYLVASQAVPVIAIAPLLTIWVPSTFWARVLVAVLVVFFPILVNTISGLRSVPGELYELMASLRATKGQVWLKLELPAALPVILAGLKVGATLSVIGALVGEFVQPQSIGLGFLLVTARYQFRTDLVFALVIILALLALGLYGLVAAMERRWLAWRSWQ